MEAMEIKNLKVNYLTLKILGIGTLGICFLLPNGKVLKLFFNKRRVRNLKYYHHDLYDHFAEINSIGNETYMVPEILLTKKYEIVGYIASYGTGHQIAHISSIARIDKIIDAYKKLVKDTKKVSKQNFKLGDVHDRNILYDEINNRFFCIDLDHGKKDNKLKSKYIMELNMRALNDYIIASLFGIDAYKREIEFYDINLQKLYETAIRREYEAMFDVLAYLQYIFCDESVTCGKLKKDKRKILTTSPVINYYDDYF